MCTYHHFPVFIHHDGMTLFHRNGSSLLPHNGSANALPVPAVIIPCQDGNSAAVSYKPETFAALVSFSGFLPGNKTGRASDILL